jgi:pimeloyl-ACP methyl ester carboxylesterase
VGWVAGFAVAAIVVFPVVMTALMTTHAPRWPIHESSLDVPHEEVRIATADGTKLSAWYVPSRNGAAVLLTHGSGGSRQRVADRAEMLARHGYGVLALDNPGNGESEGHNNGLGDNAQPGIDAALAYLTKRPGVDPERIAGFGVSLGAEVVLEAAARDGRLRAVVADGAARPSDARRYGDEPAAEEGLGWLAQQAVRAVSGMRPAPSLTGLMPRIAPRPVLLVAAGGVRDEALTNRAYRDAAGRSTTLWERPGASHTAGLKRDPGRYERRTVGFLDRALGA